MASALQQKVEKEMLKAKEILWSSEVENVKLHFKGF